MGLFLQEAQVHPGMIVALMLAGNTEPETDEHGPLLLRALMGGVPMHKKLYPLKGYPPLFQHTSEGWKPQPLTDEPLNVDVAGGLEGFDGRVRFMPIYTFTPKDAPRNMEFVVYVDSERLKYPSGRNNVYVRTNANGKILSHNGYEYGWWQQEYALPENAVLVPVGRIEVAEIPHEPAIVYKGPESEWNEIAAMLAGNAAKCGLRVLNVHSELSLLHRGPFLHLGLSGQTDEARRRFVEEVVGKGSGDFIFTNQCPYCWRTVAREHSL